MSDPTTDHTLAPLTAAAPAMHPANLAFRFGLELGALGAVSAWAFQRFESPAARYGLGIGLPLALGTIWAVFAVPGDPSRNGSPPVPIPGPARFALENALFGAATWALWDADHPILAGSLLGLVLLHTALSAERVSWLFQH